MRSKLFDCKIRQRFAYMLVVFLLIITVMWILNLMHVIGGSWSIILNAIFTAFESIISFLQWHKQATPEALCTSELAAPLMGDSQRLWIQGLVNKHKGGIVVYTPGTWRGLTFHLLMGLQKTSGPIGAASNVVEYRSHDQSLYICYFRHIPPGHYTVVATSKKRRAQITIHAGQLSEIDWR